MLERRTQRQKLRVLLVHSRIATDTAGGRSCRMLVDEFDDRNIETVTASLEEDARAIIVSDASIRALLLDWSLPGEDGKAAGNEAAKRLIETMRSRSERVPIFLLTERDKAKTLTLELVEAI